MTGTEINEDRFSDLLS